MDRLFKKRNFLSGKNAEVGDSNQQKHHDVYCESQNVNEQHGMEKQKLIKEQRSSRFSAMYNMFF